MSQEFFRYSPEKNKILKEERGISFEEMIAAIENGQLLATIRHPNQEKFPHQLVYIVQINEYVYSVPFIKENDGGIFLKTIFPSRKAKKLYTKEDNS